MIEEKLALGVYHSKLSSLVTATEREEIYKQPLAKGEHERRVQDLSRQRRAAQRHDQALREAEFARDVLSELGLSEHPKGSLLFNIAWDERHDSGYEEVWSFAQTLAELLK